MKDNVVGNAVVTLSDASGVRWSWHIWVPKDNPETTTYTHKTGKQENTFMDRNLGASRNGVVESDRNYTVGLYYQWGRKDPFPGYLKLDGTKSSIWSNTVVPMVSSVTQAAAAAATGQTTALKYALDKPLDFITNASEPFDWYSSTNQAWNSRFGDAKDECNNVYTYKSEMDPCPAGWRIPGFSGTTNADSPWAKENVTGMVASDYTSFTFSKGYDFQDSGYQLGWYAATGFLNSNNGSLGYIGRNGYYWSASASPENFNARIQTIENGHIYSWDNYRARGISVRCVQE